MFSRFGRRPLPARSVARKLRLEALERRDVPANFTIPNGDVTAFINAIKASNTNNQDDTISLAAGGIYTFTTVADTAENGNALPSILPDQLAINSVGHTLTINGNGATLTRSGAQMRFLPPHGTGLHPGQAYPQRRHTDKRQRPDGQQRRRQRRGHRLQFWRLGDSDQLQPGQQPGHRRRRRDLDLYGRRELPDSGPLQR